MRASILDFSGERFERLMAWARYLHWADVHRRHFEEWLPAADVADHERGWDFIALLSAWQASLWVVVEGWRQVPLADPAVDELLDAAPRYQELLRRYRNGIFHYQPRLIEPRITDLLNAYGGAAEWIHLLHGTFCGYYWNLFQGPPSSEGMIQKMREAAIAIVGWIPDHVPEARTASLRETVSRAVSMVQQAGNDPSPEGEALLATAKEALRVAEQTELAFERARASALERIRRENE